ncbi:FAD-dependent oxidoreductase [Aliiroseovarius sp. S2029]|uniref:NAD(P)/FAD-dependent oxidoreductase n=1 Tax=Aliiroseovarius sp. S2029 TaxID=2936988 RepID=UPI0020BEEEE4|nr:FAD-dependent oxidoreductase [Aliiroseovarius sp. S2029]MCK8484506.1 FAD-dependent oxidoreductase [Aliiroseovarius sp. S2029]
MTQDPIDIVVIGAGIIGVSAALALQARGRTPLLIDRAGVAAETSRGNAGAFAFSEVEPLATPGIMRRAPKWLLDPLGPLSIPPAYALKIAPWMLRFWRASWADRYDAAVSAQTRLMQYCQAAFERQLAQFGDPSLIRREGQLELYEGARAFELARPRWQRRADLGIDVTLLDSADAIADIQPGLSRKFTHAGFTPGWFNTTDPLTWTQTLARAYTDRGGALQVRDIHDLTPRADHIEILSDEGPILARQVVICAGAWSHRLAAKIGDKTPLETERGYNTTFDRASVELRTHLTFAAHGFVMSKIGSGLRIGGAVELGGLDLPPNYRRARVLVQKAKTFLPGLNLSGGSEWMGYRPSLPDSLPVIGPSGAGDRILYAFGHGHLGLTQSAGTAELVADLAMRSNPPIDLAPFSATRF